LPAHQIVDLYLAVVDHIPVFAAARPQLANWRTSQGLGLGQVLSQVFYWINVFKGHMALINLFKG
jgi:hypothetical protein